MQTLPEASGEEIFIRLRYQDMMADPGHDPFRQELASLIPRLRRLARALCGDATTADDLAQDALERALVNRARWQEGTRLDHWLFRIVRNLHIDGWRRDRRRGEEVGEDALDAVPGLDGRALTEARMGLRDADRALGGLGEEQRLTVVLVLVEGLSYGEAAEVLGVSPGTVASRLSRARPLLESLANSPETANRMVER